MMKLEHDYRQNGAKRKGGEEFDDRENEDTS